MLVTCTGCGQTNREVIDSYRARMQEKREQLAAIAGKLPPAGTVEVQARRELEPRPVHDTRAKGSNVEILMEANLKAPDLRLKTPDVIDLHLAGDLLRCILWTGPSSPLDTAVQEQHDSAFPAMFESALAKPWLVVVRTVRYDQARFVRAESYVPSRCELELVMVDLRNSEIVRAMKVAARSDPTVSYWYRSGDDKLERARAFAYSSLYSNVVRLVTAALARETGGTFGCDP